MRILIMVHALTGGGAERVAASWANGLSKRGNEVAILTDTIHAKQTYATDDNIRIIQVKSLHFEKLNLIKRILWHLISPVMMFFQILSILRKDKPDAVLNVLYYNSTLLWIANKLAGNRSKIIMTDHNAYELPEEVKMPWKRRKNKFFDNRFFDKVTVLTKADKTILDKKGFKNVEVLHNPLFLTPSGESIKSKKKIILSVGRLDVWYIKGFDVLIKAWSELGKDYPDWTLRIVGGGSEASLNYLMGLAKDSGGRIQFKAYTPDIVEEYKEASIYALSSRYEGWGLVLVEAMSQGCAAIACDYKGRQAEIIEDGVNGLLCPTDSVEELRDKIKLLIDDEELRNKLQNEALLNLSQYSEEETAKKLESFL